ncbi:hypothetical protein SUGI_0637480 [Cryptomeria japonica]|nr:hypothetical protein SUGI_0637480 [Cryptomeria japonica]
MNNKGWDIGFGISIGVVFLGLISIVCGIKKYRYKVPSGSFLTCIVQVFVAALRNRKLSIPEDLNDLYETNDKEIGKQGEKLWHSKQFKFLEKAAIVTENSFLSRNNMEPNPWRLCSVTQVEEVKILVRMMPIFASTIAMNTCLAQLQTFYVAQGVTMDRSMGKHFDIPAASLPIIPLVFLFILTPLYDRVFVPLARKFTGHESGITHLQRVGVGLFLSGLSMGVAALVEVKRKNVARDNGMLDAIPLIMPPLPISIFWLAFHYFVFGIAELILFAGLLEFFYTEAPARMRSLAISFSWVSLSMGFFLSTIIVDIVNAATRNITQSHGWLAGNNLNRNHLNLFYWLLAGLSMLNFFNYLFGSSWYQYKPVVQSQITVDASALDCSINF